MSKISVNEALMLIAEQKYDSKEDGLNWVEHFKANGLILSYLFANGGKQWLYLVNAIPSIDLGIEDEQLVQVEQVKQPAQVEQYNQNVPSIKSIECEVLDVPYIYYRETQIEIDDILHYDEFIFLTKSIRELKYAISQENGKLLSKVVLKDGQVYDINERGNRK